MLSQRIDADAAILALHFLDHPAFNRILVIADAKAEVLSEDCGNWQFG